MSNCVLDPVLVKQFGEALEQFGFVAVVPGPPVCLVENVFTQAEALFSLGDGVLKKYEYAQTNRQVGYTPRGVERALGAERADDKHFWQIVSPDSRNMKNIEVVEVPHFAATASLLFSELRKLGSEVVLKIIAKYLNYPAIDELSAMTVNSDTIMRIIQNWGATEEHADINLISLLVGANAPGLEIYTQGTWLPIENLPTGAVVVNSGDMLELLTGCRIPSTLHRVVPKFRGCRISCPVFIHPRREVMLAPGRTAGSVLDDRLRKIGVAG